MLSRPCSSALATAWTPISPNSLLDRLNWVSVELLSIAVRQPWAPAKPIWLQSSDISCTVELFPRPWQRSLAPIAPKLLCDKLTWARLHLPRISSLIRAASAIPRFACWRSRLISWWEIIEETGMQLKVLSDRFRNAADAIICAALTLRSGLSRKSICRTSRLNFSLS